MKAGPHGVKDPLKVRTHRGDQGARSRSARRHRGWRSTKGNPVLDLLYAGVVVVVFAILLLAVRALDRL